MTLFFFYCRCYIILSVASTVLCEVFYLGDKKINVPEVAAVDDYIACKNKNGVYCHARIKLYPSDTFKKEWEELRNNISGAIFDRTEIYRTQCIPKNISDKILDRKIFMENTIQEKELNSKYLRANVYHIRCHEKSIQFQLYDYVIMYFILIYIATVSTATILHFLYPNCTEKSWHYIYYFSLIYNWRTLVTPSEEIAKNQSLKCMQAFRAISSTLIAFGHIAISTMAGYPDASFLALFDRDWVIKSSMVFYLQLVQVFFLLSTWLVAYQLFREFDDPSKCNIGIVFRKIFYRILRTFPCLFVAVAFASSNLSLFTYSTTPISDFAYYTQRNCKTHWWLTFLYVNNEASVACYPVAWYLSADIQIYVLSSFLIYFLTKYNINKNCLGLLGILSLGAHTALLYKNHMGPVIEFKKNYRFDDLFDERVYLIHTSTISSLATASLGLLFGYVYYKYERKQTFKKQSVTTKNNKNWSTITFFLFTSYFALSYVEFGRLGNAFVAAFLKPLYAVACGSAIFGMMLNTGGPITTIFQHNIFSFFAKLSYSLYIFHPLVLTSLPNIKPFKVDLHLVISMGVCLILSHVLSLVMTLFIELPFQNLTKTERVKHEKE